MATTQSLEPPAGPDAAKIATVSAAVAGAALTAGALALFSGRTALSVAAGAILAVANLAALSAIIRAVLRPAVAEAEAEATEAALANDAGGSPEAETDPSPEPDHGAEGKRGGAAWGAFALIKMVVLFGGIYVLLTRGLVDPISLAAGYGVLPLGITASGLFSSLTPRARRPARRAPTRTE